jgi:hypothetical protein
MLRSIKRIITACAVLSLYFSSVVLAQDEDAGVVESTEEFSEPQPAMDSSSENIVPPEEVSPMPVEESPVEQSEFAE